MNTPTHVQRTPPKGRGSLLLLVLTASVAALATGLLILVVAQMPVLAALPGKDGRIAFVSQRDGNEEIYVMNADGTEQTRLTHNASTASTDATAGRDLLPSFLPDGGRVAFTSRRPIEDIHPDGGTDEVYLMDAEDRDGVPEGDNLTRLTGDVEGMQHNFQAAFSADGKKVVFVGAWNGTNTNEIYLTDFVDADGTDPARLLTESVRQLTNNALIERFPAISPDGARIAFSRRVAGGTDDIWVMNADGTEQTNLTNDAANDLYPNFSPDGTRIVFSSNRRTPDGTVDSEIYVMNADGSDPVALTNNGVLDESPVFSPDGKRIAFTSTRNGNTTGEINNKEIWLMDADGSNPVRLTNNSVEDSKPDWGPVYAWSGALQPINADGSSIFKAGSTVPVKFKLIEESAGITNASATLEVTRLSDTISGDVLENPVDVAPTTGEEFRYDDESGQYIYNWHTKGLEPGTFKLTIDLGDGTAANPQAKNHVLVSLKR
jgi:Tol biopolymer transport system component